MRKTTSMVIMTLVAVFAFVFVLQTSGQCAEFKYVGNKKCIGCHRAEFQSWQKDYHAKALESLKPGVKAEAKTKGKLDPQKDYTQDAGCLACHATGYGKPAAEGADLTNVGCEACHGPGSEYKSPKIMNKKAYTDNKEAAHKAALAAGLVDPNEANCVTCHNDKSPTWKGFDYKKMVEEVKHKK